MANPMTLRRKAQLVRLAMFTVFPLLIWLCTYWEFFQYPLWTVVAILSIACFVVRCPKCDKPVLWNRFWGRSGFWCWTLDTPRECSRCGASLE